MDNNFSPTLCGAIRKNYQGHFSPKNETSFKKAKLYMYSIRSYLVFSRPDAKFIIHVCLKGVITSVTRKHTWLSQSKNVIFKIK